MFITSDQRNDAVQLSNKSQLNNTLKLDFPWAIGIVIFFTSWMYWRYFNLHEDTSQFTVTNYVLNVTNQENKEKEGWQEEPILSLGLSESCTLFLPSQISPPPPQKIPSGICLTECKNYQSTSNSNPSGFRPNRQVKQREHRVRTPSLPHIADRWDVRKPPRHSAPFEVIFSSYKIYLSVSGLLELKSFKNQLPGKF